MTFERRAFVLETPHTVSELSVRGKSIAWVFYTLAPARLDQFSFYSVEMTKEPKPGRAWFRVNADGIVTGLLKLGELDEEAEHEPTVREDQG